MPRSEKVKTSSRFALQWLFLFALISGCRRVDNYPDYKQLRGEWKLEFIHYREASWPVDSFETRIPADKYELDFRFNPKYKFFKNGKCIRKDKIFFFDYDIYNVPPYRGSYAARLDATHWLQFEVYSYDDDFDTIHIEQFGPDSSQNGKYYDNFYVRTKD